MSLLILMYHRACAGQHGNAPEILEAHLAHIARTFPNVMPGDSLAADTLNVCLSFDDGYFDFYSRVFPLLQKYNLRALLAIPPAVIRDRIESTRAERLRLESAEAFARPERGGFCTWDELNEMAMSGYVTIAAHGFNHTRLDDPLISLPGEVETPQSVLRARLMRPVLNFVFPYGRYSRGSLAHVKRNYRYAYRIGGALNRHWENDLLYRVDADRMEDPRSLFSASRLRGYRARYLWNRLRRR